MNLKELKVKIIKRLKEFLSLINAHKVKSLFLLFLVVGIILLILKYQTIACWMYGNSDEANGKLMTLIISVIGGFCVLWGLELNGRRVKEQTRQNDIAVQNNNDKRFGEAIGYMNSDNDGIVTGGIYALYQLAKEDKRYVPLVANIFVDYVNTNSKNKGSTIILDLIFSKEESGSVWGTYIFNFKNLDLDSRILYCNNYSVNFYDCSFYSLSIVGDDCISFNMCNLSAVYILKFKSISILSGNMKYSKIAGNKAIKTEIFLCPEKVIQSSIDLDIIGMLNISPNYLENVFVNANEILNYYIWGDTKIGDGYKLCVYAKKIKINPNDNHNEEGTRNGKIIIKESNEVQPHFYTEEI